MLNYQKRVCSFSLTSCTLLIFHSDWNPFSTEQAITIGQDKTMSMLTYAVAKSKGERALWNFVDDHPDLNVTAGEYSDVRSSVY